MNLAVRDGGAWRKLGAGAMINGVWFVAATIEAMDPDERAELELDVREYAPAGAAPKGQRLVSTYIADFGAGLVEKGVYEPIPLDERKAALLAAIDAERDRRQQIDVEYDFGDTIAIDDELQESLAGVKALQMRKTAPNDDQQNWDVLQGQALAAVVMGQPQAVLPMRAQDNYNIQTTAEQVLAVTAVMVARNAAILFHGGGLKTQVRNAANGSALDAINIEIGWP